MKMIVTTAFDIHGFEVIETMGIVRGIVVRAPTFGQGLRGGLSSVFGGENASYAEMCEQTRALAYDKMVVHAMEMGANAIIGMRYDACSLGGADKTVEVLSYGTAVLIRPIAL